jgi:hypothetical protein
MFPERKNICAIQKKIVPLHAYLSTNPNNKDENKEFTSFKLYRNDVFSMQQIGFQPSVGSAEHTLWRAGF